MRAFVLDRYGEAESLTCREVAKPSVGEHDVLVDIHAAGVNPIDYKVRDGEFKRILPYRLPLILGQEVAGRVSEVGAGVTGFAVGDAVYVRLDKDRIGGFAERIAVNANVLAMKPQNLSMVEAASLPLVALTAWQALVEIAGLRAGQTVFIQAGSGGVGTVAIQLAKHLGARVVTTASAANAPWLTALGADQVIDYKTQAFDTVLKDVDVVLHSQDGVALHKSVTLLKPGGVLVSISGPPDPGLADAVGAGWVLKRIFGLLSGKVRRAVARRGARYVFHFMRADAAQLREITALVESGAIRPVVDRVFPFDQTDAALAYVATGRAKGKVVIQME